MMIFHPEIVSLSALIACNRVFSKCTRMATMPTPAPEASLRENKKIHQ